MAPKSTLSFFSSGACNNSFDEKPSSVANITVGNFCVRLLYFVTLALYVRLVAAILSSNSLTDFCRCKNCLSAFNSGYASLCMRNPLTKLEASFDFFTFPHWIGLGILTSFLLHSNILRFHDPYISPKLLPYWCAHQIYVLKKYQLHQRLDQFCYEAQLIYCIRQLE